MFSPSQHLLVLAQLASDRLGGSSTDAHQAIPMGVVAVLLFLVAGVVRKIIKLFVLIVLAGVCVGAFALWRSGALSS